jgi:hypothetical protein
MNRPFRTLALLAGLLCLWAAAAHADEPLVGRWQMISLKVDGQAAKPMPVAIKIRQAGPTTLTFTYVSGREEKVNMTFTVALDGNWAPIEDIAGARIGAAKLTRSGSKYNLVLQSAGKPPEPGTMVLSERNQILTCAVGSEGADKSMSTPRIVQVFSRDSQ